MGLNVANGRDYYATTAYMGFGGPGGGYGVGDSIEVTFARRTDRAVRSGDCF